MCVACVCVVCVLCVCVVCVCSVGDIPFVHYPYYSQSGVVIISRYNDTDDDL